MSSSDSENLDSQLTVDFWGSKGYCEKIQNGISTLWTDKILDRRETSELTLMELNTLELSSSLDT